MSISNSYRNSNPSNLFNKLTLQRGFFFGLLIILALFAFEVFNYSTTEFALGDVLGDLRFLGIRWATILAIAFCGIDFAGIARLFTPERGAEEPAEIWYLFGAWLLAAAMNAILTWWGVSVAIVNHETLGNAVVDRQTLLKVVPVFVAVMVWLIRVLIIGTFSVAGEHLLWDDVSVKPGARPQATNTRAIAPVQGYRQTSSQAMRPISAAPANNPVANFRPAPKAYNQQPDYPDYGYSNHPEPVYQPIGMSGRMPTPAPKPSAERPTTANGGGVTSIPTTRKFEQVIPAVRPVLERSTPTTNRPPSPDHPKNNGARPISSGRPTGTNRRSRS
jgi:hypothetical protein